MRGGGGGAWGGARVGTSSEMVETSKVGTSSDLEVISKGWIQFERILERKGQAS